MNNPVSIKESPFKINLSAEAAIKFKTMLQDVNSSSIAGKIKKQELADWIINFFHEKHFNEQKSAIQKVHFDETIFLEKLLKNKSQLPLEIRQAVQKAFENGGAK